MDFGRTRFPFAKAEISMGAISQCTAGADLVVQYKNLTPDSWDLRGYVMTIDSVSVSRRVGGSPPGLSTLLTCRIGFGS